MTLDAYNDKSIDTDRCFLCRRLSVRCSRNVWIALAPIVRPDVYRKLVGYSVLKPIIVYMLYVSNVLNGTVWWMRCVIMMMLMCVDGLWLFVVDCLNDWWPYGVLVLMFIETMTETAARWCRLVVCIYCKRVCMCVCDCVCVFEWVSKRVVPLYDYTVVVLFLLRVISSMYAVFCWLVISVPLADAFLAACFSTYIVLFARCIHVRMPDVLWQADLHAQHPQYMRLWCVGESGRTKIGQRGVLLVRQSSLDLYVCLSFICKYRAWGLGYRSWWLWASCFVCALSKWKAKVWCVWVCVWVCVWECVCEWGCTPQWKVLFNRLATGGQMMLQPARHVIVLTQLQRLLKILERSLTLVPTCTQTFDLS